MTHPRFLPYNTIWLTNSPLLTMMYYPASTLLLHNTIYITHPPSLALDLYDDPSPFLTQLCDSPSLTHYVTHPSPSLTILYEKRETTSTYWLSPRRSVSPAALSRAWLSPLLRQRVGRPLMALMTSPSRTPSWAALLPGFTWNNDSKVRITRRANWNIQITTIQHYMK